MLNEEQGILLSSFIIWTHLHKCLCDGNTLRAAGNTTVELKILYGKWQMMRDDVGEREFIYPSELSLVAWNRSRMPPSTDGEYIVVVFDNKHLYRHRILEHFNSGQDNDSVKPLYETLQFWFYPQKKSHRRLGKWVENHYRTQTLIHTHTHTFSFNTI